MSQYVRKGVTFDLAPDYSTVKITQGDQVVVLDGNAFADVMAVMKAGWKSGEIAKERLWNIVRTSNSLPEGDWADID